MAVSEHEEPVADDAAAARLRAATEALEAVVRDRTLLRQLSVEERTRLLSAAGAVFTPDVATRRRAVKELKRREKNERTRLHEEVRAETGIRVLREKPVFTTPNVYAPSDYEEPTAARDARAAQHS